MKQILCIVAFLSPGAVLAGHELENRNLGNGRILYQEHCASCHGVGLEGEPNWQQAGKDGLMPAPPHDATGHTWHHDNILLFLYTKYGGKALMEARGLSGFKSGMPGFGDVVRDDGIWDILAYIRSTWPEKIKTIQASRNRPHDQ